MNDEDDMMTVARRALVTEGIALAAVAAVLWYTGPGKIWIGGLFRRAEIYMESRRSAVDVQVAAFASEVSRWDHEQAAQQDRRPGRRGPCGCG